MEVVNLQLQNLHSGSQEVDFLLVLHLVGLELTDEALDLLILSLLPVLFVLSLIYVPDMRSVMY